MKKIRLTQCLTTVNHYVTSNSLPSTLCRPPYILFAQFFKQSDLEKQKEDKYSGVQFILHCVNVGNSLDFSCMHAQACRPIEGFFFFNITFILLKE